MIEGLVSLLHEARRNPSALVDRARSDPRLSRIIEGECRACPFRALCPVEKALRGPRRGGGSV